MNETTPKVLIVEDDFLQSESLKEIVKKCGFQPTPRVAATADEAVQFALEENPHVVLMDIKLAENQNGLDAAGRIRKTNHQTMPIIFLTAFSEEWLPQLEKIGFFAFLTKPPKELLVRETIKTAVAHHHYHQSVISLQKQLADERSTKVSYAATGLLHTANNLLAACMGVGLIPRESNLREIHRIARKVENVLLQIGKLTNFGVGLARGLDFGSPSGDINTAVNSATDLMAELFARDAVIKRQLVLGPLHVKIHQLQLELLLYDLGVNAKNAIWKKAKQGMQDDGTITFRTKRVLLDPDTGAVTTNTNQGRHYACVEVEDNGCGIEPTKLQSLFERQLQISEVKELIANDLRTSGLGLGLWLLKNIVTGYGGFVPIPDSTVGKGTTMRFFLPLKETPH